MKIRSILAVAALVLSTSASFADGDTVFGILKVDDDSTTNLLISVPWVDCTDGSENVLISNVVKTTNLAVNDMLVVKKGSDYYAWKLMGTPPALTWAAVTTVGETFGGVSITAADPDKSRIARGDSLFLCRNNPKSSTPIYLFGRYSASEVTTSIISGATTLCANPGTEPLALGRLNSGSGNKFTVGTPAAGDKVIVNTVAGTKTYTFIDGGWKSITKAQGTELPSLPGMSEPTYQNTVTTNDADSVSIPAGKGFWYKSKTGSGTITW